MLKTITLILFIFSSNLFAASDVKELKLDAAKRYLASTPVDSMMKDVVTNMAKNMQPEQAKEFKALMLTHLDIKRLENVMLTAMVNNFTLNEINAIADFYGSEIGRSSMKKFGAYMAEVQPTIQQEIQNALQKLEAEKQ